MSVPAVLLVAALVAVPSPAAAAESASPDRAAAQRLVALVDTGDGLEVVTWQGDDPRSLVSFKQRADALGRVVAVETDVFMTPAGDPDPFRGDQWALDRLDTDRLHRFADGDGVTIAVIDTAVALGHEDLSGQLVAGHDVFGDIDRPLPLDDPTWQRGDGSHGSHVTGVIVADAGNEVGIHGVAPGARVMPVRAIEPAGGFMSDIAEAVILATDAGVDVINLSVATTQRKRVLADAVAYAIERGVVVVAAAGNNGALGSPTTYPAAFDGVIGVGATTSTDEIWGRSNTNGDVDLFAPGAEVFSTGGWNARAYVSFSGTSMAGPHVVGVAALALDAARQVGLDIDGAALAEVLVDTADATGVVDPLAVLAKLFDDDRLSRPGPLAIRRDGGRVELSWDPPVSAEAVRYAVRLGDDIVARPSTPSAEVRSSPDRWLPIGVEVEFVDGSTLDHPAAPAPVGLTTTVVDNTVELRWNRTDGESHVVFRDGEVLGVVGTGGTVTPQQLEPPAFVDREPEPGVTHRYGVAKAVALGLTGAMAAAEPVTLPAADPVSPPVRPDPPVDQDGGYWIVTDRGRVLGFGDAADLGQPAPDGAPVVAGAAAPDGRGYWVARADGTVEAFGSAVHSGDVGGLDLRAPVVAMGADPLGRGYWLVGSDGGVFSLGVPFYGSTGAIDLAAPVIDFAPTPSGRGYWFVARDGGVFSYGDATFRGSTGGMALDRPVTSMTPGPAGYWLIAEDGGIFAFGVPFHGSLPGLGPAASDAGDGVRVRAVDGGAGYLLLTDDGTVFPFGSAEHEGDAGDLLAADEHAVDLLLP